MLPRYIARSTPASLLDVLFIILLLKTFIFPIFVQTPIPPELLFRNSLFTIFTLPLLQSIRTDSPVLEAPFSVTTLLTNEIFPSSSTSKYTAS
jgi:hypothetical protein